MKHAILIQCHRITNALIYNLAKIKNSNNVVAYIHVDLDTDITPFLSFEEKNIFIIENRVSVKWGNYSQILATLNLFSAINENDNIDYISLISGDDIITKSFSLFEQFLLTNNNTEFIGVRPQDEKSLIQNRLQYIYPDFFFEREPGLLSRIKIRIFSFQLRLTPKKYLNKNFSSLPTVYKGSNWFTLTNDAVMYIKKYIATNAEIIEAFKYSFCGDELFFQTILMDSPFRHKINMLFHENDNLASLRFIEWGQPPDTPKTFKLSDFPKIKSSNTFFCRKIDPSIKIETIMEFFDDDN